MTWKPGHCTSSACTFCETELLTGTPKGIQHDLLYNPVGLVIQLCTLVSENTATAAVMEHSLQEQLDLRRAQELAD